MGKCDFVIRNSFFSLSDQAELEAAQQFLEQAAQQNVVSFSYYAFFQPVKYPKWPTSFFYYQNVGGGEIEFCFCCSSSKQTKISPNLSTYKFIFFSLQTRKDRGSKSCIKIVFFSKMKIVEISYMIYMILSACI